MSNFSLRVVQDSDPQNPREDDNFGHMVCFHNRYSLGDKDHGIKTSDFSGWDEMAEYLYKVKGAFVVLPIFLMDHSGLSMSTSSFACPWDSGQVGFIYMTKWEARENFQVKRLTRKVEAKVVAALQSVVETYDAYLRGDVWGFEVVDSAGDVVDSAWGFLSEESAQEEGRSILVYYEAA